MYLFTQEPNKNRIVISVYGTDWESLNVAKWAPRWLGSIRACHVSQALAYERHVERSQKSGQLVKLEQTYVHTVAKSILWNGRRETELNVAKTLTSKPPLDDILQHKSEQFSQSHQIATNIIRFGLFLHAFHKQFKRSPLLPFTQCHLWTKQSVHDFPHLRRTVYCFNQLEREETLFGTGPASSCMRERERECRSKKKRGGRPLLVTNAVLAISKHRMFFFQPCGHRNKKYSALIFGVCPPENQSYHRIIFCCMEMPFTSL